MGVVLKVSKPGFEVMTTGNENLTFNAELATHSIHTLADVSKGSGVTSVTYTHNLGYIPKVWVFWKSSDGDGAFYRRIPMSNFSIDPFDYYITTTTIVISCGAFSSGNIYDFKVIIFTRSPNI